MTTRPSPSRAVPRLARPFRPWGILLGLAGMLTVIARTTGSGWAMVIVSGLLATFVIGALWPAVALLRTRVAVEAPRDATVGRHLSLRMINDGPQPVVLEVPALDTGRVAAAAGVNGTVSARARRRGVVESLDVVVRCAAPLGLAWWTRTDTVRLATPLEIGPDPARVPLPATLAGRPGDEQPPARRAGTDAVRSVRDYVYGDPARFVHWGATARRGELMVKELEDPEGSLLAVIADLRGGEEAAEGAASRAAGVCVEALRAGVRVILLTDEAGRPRVGPVANAVEVGRRLARATSGEPPEGPLPWGATVLRISAERANAAEGKP